MKSNLLQNAQHQLFLYQEFCIVFHIYFENNRILSNAELSLYHIFFLKAALTIRGNNNAGSPKTLHPL